MKSSALNQGIECCVPCVSYHERVPTNTINPATALADLLQSWHVPARKYPQSVRFNGAVETAEFWLGHRIAVRYLMEVEDALTALEAQGEEVQFYRDTVPVWYRAVFSQSQPWNSTATEDRRVASETELRLLRALGGHINAIKWVPNLDPNHLTSLREALDRAKKLVLSDADISEDVKRYLLGLIHEASQAFDESELADGVFIRRITMELGGAMTTVSELKSDDDPKKKTWVDAAKGLLRSIGDKITQKAIETGVDYAATALGGVL